MVVVIDSSVPRRVARFQPVWRKCMTTTIRPVSTMILIGLSETNTIGYYDLGEFGRASDLPRQNVETADLVSGRPGTNSLILSQAWLARTLSWLGAFAEGRRYGEEALRLATVEGLGMSPIIAHGCLGLLCLAQGDLEYAIRMFDQGLALGRASDLRIWLPNI